MARSRSGDIPAIYAERQKIAKKHENYHRGLLHFLATDKRVPERVREDMRRFGLPKDESLGTCGWPHQLYIREARRMVSTLVMREHHTFGRQIAGKSIGLGHGMDGKSHPGYKPPYHPLKRGFDCFYGILGGAHSFLENPRLIAGREGQRAGRCLECLERRPRGAE